MLALDPNDTIAAIASPTGPAARGIIRVSGPHAWSVALADFEPDRPGPLPKRPTRVEGHYRLDGLAPRLPAAIALWPAPRTYTGQELAELHTIGSPPLLQHLLAHILNAGARRAEPGEFTLRAFLSGRIDLTQAEAVMGVIEARDTRQLELALRQLAGGLTQRIDRIRDHLLDILAHVEAGLDFVDEADVSPIARSELLSELQSGAAELDDILKHLQARDRPGHRPRVVLVGPANAGKSRLYNALSGSDQAIVSPRAGTTRDYLESVFDCGGIEIELIDTAGVEPVLDSVQSQAQAQREGQTQGADLVLRCQAADDTATYADTSITGQASLRVATKCDLAPAPSGTIATSAVARLGLAELRAAIAATLSDTPQDESAILASTSARCRESLTQAASALRNAIDGLTRGDGDELAAIELRQALDELGQVVGAVVTDDILDRIFARFCIGK